MCAAGTALADAPCCHSLPSANTLQVVSQVARVSSPNLPPLITTLYRSVSVLQLEGIVLPPVSDRRIT